MVSEGAPGGLDESEVARRLRAEHPANTAEAYLKGWEAWRSWAKRSGVCALQADPEDVAAYLSDLAADGRAVSTIKLRRAAIRAAHRAAGLDDPGRAEEVAREVARIASTSSAPPQRPEAVPTPVVQRAAALAAGEGSDVAKRDAAILELLSTGWLRPGELVRLDWTDLRASPADSSATIRLRGSDGAEALVEAPASAWRRLREWRRAVGEPEAGPMFIRLGTAGSARLGPRDLRRIVAGRLAAVGVTGATPRGLRAGAAVTAFQNGSSLTEVLRLGRWIEVRAPAWYAAAAEAAAAQRPTGGAEPTAEAATAAYLAAEAAAAVALDDLQAASAALHRAVGPRRAAAITGLPPNALERRRTDIAGVIAAGIRSRGEPEAPMAGERIRSTGSARRARSETA